MSRNDNNEKYYSQPNSNISLKKKYLRYDHITKGNVDPKLNRDVKYLYLR